MRHEILGAGLAIVPKGADIRLSLRLESVHEGIYVSGGLKTEAQAECSRCLEPLTVPVQVDIQELFAYSSQSDEDLEVINEHVDLEQVLIDSVVLNLPFQPVCSKDCLGLCSECGIRLDENTEHSHEKPVDPRFSALQGLASKED